MAVNKGGPACLESRHPPEESKQPIGEENCAEDSMDSKNVVWAILQDFSTAKKMQKLSQLGE
jgi:hypothetical protein